MSDTDEMIFEASEDFAYGLIDEESYRGILEKAKCGIEEVERRVANCKAAHGAWLIEQKPKVTN